MKQLWPSDQKSRRWRRGAGVLVSGLMLLSFGAVAGMGASAASPKTSNKPIVVWVDAARLPMVKAYAKAHPSIKLDVVTFDGGANGSGSIESKVALFNRVGHGWPDIVFSTEQNDVQTLGASPFKFPATLNKGLVSTSILKKYTSGALAPCYMGTKLECLRNDLAFDVLWVNVPLMKQFGYTIPTTWQQWQSIGESVAANHPGYIIGTLGNSYDDAVYLQAAQCHMNDLINQYTVLDNPADPNCVKMANLLNPLLKDGSVPAVNVFSATFPKTYSGKVLMMVGPAWYGGAIFDSTSGLNSAKGTIEAAAPLTWAGNKTTTTGDVGGGLWIMSSHSAKSAGRGAGARRPCHFDSVAKPLAGLPGLRARGGALDSQAGLERLLRQASRTCVCQGRHGDLDRLVADPLGRLRPLGRQRHAEPGSGQYRFIPAACNGVGDIELRTI